MKVDDGAMLFVPDLLHVAARDSRADVYPQIPVLEVVYPDRRPVGKVNGQLP
jgi:hypothetical protein